MWSNAICFPTSKETQDADGFPVISTVDGDQIKASFTDATRNDETLAQARGYTASIIVKIMSCNYKDQGYFKDCATGNTYDIKRTYRQDRSGIIELTGEIRENGKS